MTKTQGVEEVEPATADEGTKKFEGAIKIEQSFKVDGKKLTVFVTFPGEIVKNVGMEALLLAANRAIVTVDSKIHRVEKIR